MARRFRSLNLDHVQKVSPSCGPCLFWETSSSLEQQCGAKIDRDDAVEWFSRVVAEWGECGRTIVEDDVPLGFIKYAPSRFFPQAMTFPSPPDPDIPFIACLHVIPEARGRGLGKLLLHAAAKDLTSRGARKVQAIGYGLPLDDPGDTPMLPTTFLLRNGFTATAPHPTYPLLELELRSLAVLTENLEAMLDALRLPLTSPRQAPVPWT